MRYYILSPATGISKSLVGLLFAAISLMGGAMASAAETDAPNAAGGSPARSRRPWKRPHLEPAASGVPRPCFSV